MIRGNYSLAREVRKNELRQRQRLQQKQKDAHLREKLQAVDPARLFYRIQRLEGDPKAVAQLKKLRSEWAFMEKHGIHREKVAQLVAQQKQKQIQEENARKKLWGRQSVYFNPELNPLGKVPAGYPNVTKPVAFEKPEADARIEQWGIQAPAGEPPQYYRKVQNTSVAEATAAHKKRRVGKQ